MLKFADIIEAISGIRPEWADQNVSGAVVDSRQAVPGCLFVALPGEHHDGHDFVGEAFAGGAMIAIVDRNLGEDFSHIDLRRGATPPAQKPDFPLCLLVDNSLSGLQQTARFWRSRTCAIRSTSRPGSAST